MKPEEFVSAYRRDATERADGPPEVVKLLAPARAWSRTWGALLHDALALRHVPPEEQFLMLSRRYIAWIQTGFQQLVPDLEAWVERTEDQDTFLRAMMELNFHALNVQVQNIWLSLFYAPPGYGPNPYWVERARGQLALASLGMDKVREMLVDEDVFFDSEASPVRAWHTGALTEFDAYIALLDLTRRRGTLFVVPAPAQFEHLAGPANADFVVIDRQNAQVLGVQVKAKVSQQAAHRYDRKRITLIDGDRDLQNTRAMRTDRLSSNQRSVAWPGLISAHFLMGLKPSPRTNTWVQEQALTQKKMIARHYVDQVPSRNRQAFAAVAERVLHDLNA